MTATQSLVHRDLQNLPFKSHPLFFLRKYTMISALVGIILCAVSNVDYGPPTPNQFTIFLLLISILVCFCDLLSYARKKGDNPDEDPKWPITKFMFMDVLLAVVLFFTFWACIVFLSTMWYYDAFARVLQAYGALAGLVCSILHATAFWKQLMARKKQAWITSLPREPCARCGYTEISDERTAPPAQQSRAAQESHTPYHPNMFAYAGPSADFRKANVLTPERSESAMGEGLLIGSDFEGGYQTISKHDETTVEQPESVVVVKGKGKGKKKASSHHDSSSADGPAEIGLANSKTAERYYKNAVARLDTSSSPASG